MSARQFISFIFPLFLCAACADKYSIAGNSSMPTLDGRMLYLRVNGSNDGTTQHISIDSCEVVHGKFNFMGFIDSIMMAELCMGNEHMMPLVLENADLEIHMHPAGQHVSGGPLNDRLYKFFKKKSHLENELWELQQQSIRMMRNGETAEEIHRKVYHQNQRLNAEIEALETQFVIDNYDNVLGPGIFIFLTEQYQYPIMTKQMRTILQDAPPVFMQHPHVVRFIRSVEQ